MKDWKRSRTPFHILIQRQRMKIENLDNRIGRLMTQRADEEDILGDMLKQIPRHLWEPP